MRNRGKIILLLAIVIATQSVWAQKKSKLIDEGRIVYDLSVTGGDMNSMMAAMIPTEMTMYIKGNKLRNELNGTGWSNVTIADTKAHTSIALIDMLGNKKARSISAEEVEKNYAEHKPTINILKETKDIAGFKCTKAEIVNSKGETSYVYFTKAIAARNGTNINLRDIDGFLMEYQTLQNGIAIKLSARSVNGAYKVENNLFKIPGGYEELTKEDLQKFGGSK